MVDRPEAPVRYVPVAPGHTPAAERADERCPATLARPIVRQRRQPSRRGIAVQIRSTTELPP